MTRILFIIPAFKHGGTNKSLSNILSFIKDEFDITILALSHLGSYKKIFENEVKIIEKDPYLSILFDDFGAVNLKEDSIKQVITNLANKIYRKLFKAIIGEKGREKIMGKVAKSVENMNFDTIVAMQEGNATNFASRINSKKVAWVRSDYNEYYKIIKNDESAIYEKYQAIICVSEYTKSTFLDKYPQFENKCYGIHNMIDDKKIIEMANIPIEDNELFDNSRFTIISIGRLSKVKQFELIPNVVKNLKVKGFQVNWYIIGDGEEKPIISELIKNNGVEGQVLLLGEISNPYPYIKHSDLVVVTSFSEACPNVLNESKILHIPVITTNFGSAKEFIDSGVNGIITTEKNIDNDIAKIIEDKNYYKTIESNIRDFEYSNDDIIKQVVSLLK